MKGLKLKGISAAVVLFLLTIFAPITFAIKNTSSVLHNKSIHTKNSDNRSSAAGCMACHQNEGNTKASRN